MSDTTRTSRRHPLSWRLGATLAATAAAAIVLTQASPAAAHHGWDGFDTDRLLYVAGTVSSDGSWGEPHSYFDLAVAGDLPADTPELAIPEELQNPEDSSRVDAALSYSGARTALEVIIAPPAFTGRWGLDRALAVGERFQAVGYVNRSDDGLFRPVVFWYGDDAVPVNQVLGNTLPVRAPLPDPTATGGETPAPSTTSTALDPIEDSESSAEARPSPITDAGTSVGEDGSGGVWAVFGVVVLAAVAGGFLYLRRRSQRS